MTYKTAPSASLRAKGVIDGSATGDGYTTLHTQAPPSPKNPWPASTVLPEDDENQSNLLDRSIRKTATIPINQPRKFIRVSGRVRFRNL